MAEKARERAFLRMLEHAAAAGGNGKALVATRWTCQHFSSHPSLYCYFVFLAVIGVQFTGQEILEVSWKHVTTEPSLTIFFCVCLVVSPSFNRLLFE